jgi:hypothetical protein
MALKKMAGTIGDMAEAIRERAIVLLVRRSAVLVVL